MVALSSEEKQFLFAAAATTKKTKSTTTAKVKKTRTTKKTTKEPDPTGMMMAANFQDTEANKPKEKTKKAKSENKGDSKRDNFYKELNKYGLTALVAGTLANHTINTAYKLSAAIDGQDEKFKHYEEKSKNYIKPHFSLPSQWYQTRITFGTPWYY